jgi:NAD(P)H-nitrite reductase large subunit
MTVWSQSGAEQGYPVSEPLVIVGNGMAAARLVDELTRCALARHTVAVIGDEPRLAYNRVLLSSVLAGETAPEDIEHKPMSWWRDRGVTLKVGCPATEIDVGRREIKIANDASVSVFQACAGYGIRAAAVDCAKETCNKLDLTSF